MMTIRMSRQVERRRISRASQALETLSSVLTARIAGLNECDDGKQSSARAEDEMKSAGQLSKKAKQLTSLPSRSRPVFKNPKKMTFQRRKNSISSNSSDEVDSSQGELRQYVLVFQLGSLSDTLQVTRSYLRMTAQWPTTAARSLRPPVVSPEIEAALLLSSHLREDPKTPGCVNALTELNPPHRAS